MLQSRYSVSPFTQMDNFKVVSKPLPTAFPLHSSCAAWERSVFILIPKKGNTKECSNYSTIELVPHASKVTFKILQTKLQQYVNCELPDVQAGFRKGRGTRDQIANICWVIKKATRVPEKHLLLLY